MNVLFLTKHSNAAASSRYRTYQYLPYYSTKGISYRVEPFFNEEYLKRLYAKKSISILNLTKLFLKRFGILFYAWKYEIIFIEKEVIPYFPPFFELLFKIFKKKIIIDYDDAIFHNYDLSKNIIVKFILKNKIGRIIKWAKHIVVGNEYIADFALKYNTEVSKIPTVIDLERYKLSKDQKNNKNIFVIGWIGSPSSSYNLLIVLKALTKFSKTHEFKIKIIGCDLRLKEYFNDLPVEFIEWNWETEIEEIKSFNVGIMPLDDSPWSKGKCGFKLIQYMACSKPVIASPVGENTQIIDEGVNGYLAENVDSWFDILSKLFHDRNLCARLGHHGRKKVEEYYAMQVTAPQYLNLINKIANNSN